MKNLNSSCVCGRAALIAGSAGTIVSLLGAGARAAGVDYRWLTAASGSWNTGTNWNPVGVPANADDTATIDATGAAYTVSLDVSPSITGFTLDSADATFFNSGQTLTVTGTSDLQAGVARMISGAWAGGALSNGANATMELEGNSSISAALTNAGLIWIRGTSSNNTNATLGAFTNTGVLKLESIQAATQANLAIAGGGTLTNSGELDVNAGSGGSRQLSGSLLNDTAGTTNVNASFNITAGGATVTNKGTFTVASGATLTMSAGSQVFNQNAGTLDIEGALDFRSMSFNYNGGAITGSVVLQSSTLTIDAAATGAATFVMQGNTALVGDVHAGQTVWVNGNPSYNSTLTSNAFTNNGVVKLESSGAPTQSLLTIAGAGLFTNNGEFDINSGGGGQRQLSGSLSNTALGVTNVNASLALTAGGTSVTNAGSLTVASGVTLTMSAGSQVFNQNAGVLDVEGALDFRSMSFNYNGGTITGNAVVLQSSTLSIDPAATNAATFVMQGNTSLVGNVLAGQTVWVNGNPSYNSTLTSNAFTNNGTVKLESTSAPTQSLLTISGAGLFTNNGEFDINAGGGGQRQLSGSLTNAATGTTSVNTSFAMTAGSTTLTNSGALTVAPGATMTMSAGSQVFNQNAGTFDVEGALDFRSMSFHYNGGAITGNAVVLQNSGLSIDASATGAAAFVMQGNTSLSGDVHAGQTVWVNGNPSYNSTLTSGAFTNNGVVKLESTGAPTQSFLTISGVGLFTNNGEFDVNPGSNGGGRQFSGSLANAGTANINQSCSFTAGGATFGNVSAFNIGAGAVLTLSGGSQVFTQTAGLIDDSGGMVLQSGVFSMNGGAIANSGQFLLKSSTFNYNDGVITGNALELENSTLNIAASGGAAFIVRGGSNLTGDIHAGQSVWVNGNSTYNSTLTANPFTNSGLLKLESSNAGTQSFLTINGAGLLTNSGEFDINAGSGGARQLSGSLANTAAGTTSINTFFAMTAPGAVLSNDGLVAIAPGATLAMSAGSQAFNQNAGTLDIQGAVDFRSMSFSYKGGAITGNSPVLQNSALSIDAAATGGVTFIVQGGCTLTGDIHAGQTVWVNGTPSYNSILTSNAFTNSGVLKLESSDAATQSFLTLSGAGLFTNSGEFDVNIGSGGGTRQLAGSLASSGTVNIAQTLAASTAGTSISNSGAFNINSGAALNMTAGSQTFNQNAGTLSNDGALNIVSGAFNYNGGAITQTLSMRNSALSIAPGATNPAHFVQLGNSAFSGNLLAGQTLDIHGDASQHAVMTSAPFTNSGTLNVGSESGTNAALNVTGTGALTNAAMAQLTITADTGGARSINAELHNAGMFHSLANASLGLAGANHVNDGVIAVEAGILSTTGNTFTNDAGGVLEGYGTINVSQLAAHLLANAGTIAPGMSIGAMSITGGVTNSASAILAIEIGSLASNDVLSVSGADALDGSIAVTLLGGYLPSVGDSFRVLNYGSHSGTFADVTTVAGGSVTWSAQYFDGYAQITVVDVPAPGAGLFGALGAALLGIAHRRRRA